MAAGQTAPPALVHGGKRRVFSEVSVCAVDLVPLLSRAAPAMGGRTRRAIRPLSPLLHGQARVRAVSRRRRHRPRRGSRWSSPHWGAAPAPRWRRNPARAPRHYAAARWRDHGCTPPAHAARQRGPRRQCGQPLCRPLSPCFPRPRGTATDAAPIAVAQWPVPRRPASRRDRRYRRRWPVAHSEKPPPPQACRRPSDSPPNPP